MLPRNYLVLTVLALAACESGTGTNISAPVLPRVSSTELARKSDQKSAALLNAVLAGNAQSISAAPTLVPPGAPLAPFIEARLYAIANVAMHDALNAVTPRYARYADKGPVDGRANAVVAVLTAAHDAIVGAAPGSQSSTDAWYSAAMGALTDNEEVDRGVVVGRRAAVAILARRAMDGVADGGVGPYHPGSNPGDYRFTFPFNTPGFDFFGTGGFADASNWGRTVTPFVITSASQFRPGAPYSAASNAAAVQTPEYTSDFNEVKALGCAGCTARTAGQTEIALFWMENSPTGWNRIARIVADQRNLDAVDAARLFALLQMGEFDAYTSSLEAKYFYHFWRPVTAVALAATDGNPLTSTVADWEVLAFPTPPVPDYPSAHATAGGNAAAILEALMPGRAQRFSTTSGSLSGVTRTFSSVAAAAEENRLSRIYIGYHFRHATAVGLAQGRAVGAYVVTHALRPLNGDDHEDDRD
jgi:PAP2 superfamily